MFVLFASTYICEQTFFIMKVNKSKNRSLLIDPNLQSVLRIGTRNSTPNFNKLVNDCSQMHHLLTLLCYLCWVDLMSFVYFVFQMNVFHVKFYFKILIIKKK